MKIAILGTGIVGQTIGSKLVATGHDVRMGSRSAGNDKALAWAKSAGGKTSVGTFADAAGFADLAFNCTAGAGTLEMAKLVGSALDGKILVDLANPLDFSRGMPPTLFVSNTDSLGEQLQRALPEAQVVKSLNTVNAQLMVEPASVGGGDHAVFMSGNDAGAKGQVRELLASFGWRQIIDLGDITTARGVEQLLPLWVRLYGHFASPAFNFKVVR